MANPQLADQVNITVAEGGIQGLRGIPGSDGAGGSSTNLTGLISTGSASGLFYLKINPDHFAPSGFVTGISGSLNEKISSINFNLGNYLLSGDPKVVYTTGLQTISGNKTFANTVGFSGDIFWASAVALYDRSNQLIMVPSRVLYDNSSNATIDFDNSFLSSTTLGGQSLNWKTFTLQTGGVTTLNWSGRQLTGAWNAQSLNISGQSINVWINNLSGALNSSGSSLVNLIASTGTSLQNQINVISSIPLVTGISIAGAIPRISGDVILTSSSNIIIGQGANGFTFQATIPAGFANSGQVENTGTALQNQVNTERNSPRITGIIFNSGTSLTGQLVITGLGSISIQQTGNSIFILGATGFLSSYITNSNLAGFSSSGNLETTGTNIQNQINTITVGTGLLYSKTNPNNFSTSGNLETTGTNLISLISTERNKNTLTGISVSGGIGITGNFNINAGSNITLTQQGTNTLSIAASASAGGSTIISAVTGSGLVNYFGKFTTDLSGINQGNLSDSGSFIYSNVPIISKSFSPNSGGMNINPMAMMFAYQNFR